MPELLGAGLDRRVAEIDEKESHSWAGGGILRQIYQNDFLQTVFGIGSEGPQTAAVADELIKAVAGEDLPVPEAFSTEPTTASSKPKASRKKKIQQMVEEFVAQLDEAGSKVAKKSRAVLLTSIQKYVEDSMRRVAHDREWRNFRKLRAE